MDGAGTTIFDRIEQKLAAHGANAGTADLKEAVAQYDAKIASNPADVDSKIIDLELKVALLARLLNAAVDVMDGHAAPAEEPPEAAKAAASAAGPVKKVKRLRQNPATGVIEEIEDVVEDNVIVADGRGKFASRGNDKKNDKKTVFIQATDDEPVGPTKK